MPIGQQFYTVGYQGVSLDQLLDSLAHAGVTLVVDTRETPMSRRAEFRGGALAKALSGCSIDYVSLPQLGAPRALRDLVDAWDQFAAGYRSLLVENEAAVTELVRLSAGRSVCLLCFEDDPAACHRSLLIEELERQLPAARTLHLRPGRVDQPDDGEGVRVGLHRAHDKL
jgi:uncharacterized protein (DUF488 family)